MWQCHEENCSKKTLVITLIPNNTNAELVERYHKPKLSDYLNNSNTKYDHHFVVNNQSETLFCNICQQIIRKISIRKKYHINMYITTYNIV